MKHVVLISFLLISCSPSPEEQAVYNAEAGITDIKSLEKVGVLTAGDSVPILNKILDSIAYEKTQNLIPRINHQIDLISERNLTGGSSKNYDMILKELEKRLSYYQSKTYDSTDLRDTYARLKRYQSNPDSVLADKYRCIYIVGKQEIEKTYYFKNGKVVK